MCYDSGYHAWLRRAARMQEEMKREEERKKQGRAPTPARTAAPETEVKEQPVPA